MKRSKKEILKTLDNIKDKDIVYDEDSQDTSDLDLPSVSFAELEKMRLASVKAFDENPKEIKDKKLSVKVSDVELQELKEFWGKNYTSKIRKFLLDFVHSSQTKHS